MKILLMAQSGNCTLLRQYLTTFCPTYARMSGPQKPSSDLVAEDTQKLSKIAEEILKGEKSYEHNHKTQ